MLFAGGLRSVCHITTVHEAHDVRISLKECAALAAAGWTVHLVAPGELRGQSSGIRHHSLGAIGGGRIRRMCLRGWRAWRIASRLEADVYHFHDPELIALGLLLRARGRRVVYDVHENVPEDILSKSWIPPLLRRPIALAMEWVEQGAAKVLAGIVAATPEIARRFPGERTEVIQNFPIAREFATVESRSLRGTDADFVYVGGLTRSRGAEEMVSAMELVDHEAARLHLAGRFESDALRLRLKSMPGWRKVDFRGWLDRGEIAQLLRQARAGLVVLHPLPNYLESWPIKLFEYMAAGVPVIASDFPLWREIVEGADCGLLVDARNPMEMARAMQWMLDHPEESRSMGERGRRAVEERYNWEGEAAKLARFYELIAR